MDSHNHVPLKSIPAKNSLQFSPCVPLVFFPAEKMEDRSDGSLPPALPLRIVHDQRISPSDAAYCALPHDLRTANFTDMLDALKYAVAGQGTNGPA